MGDAAKRLCRLSLHSRNRLVAALQLNKFDDWWRPEQSLQRVILEGLHYILEPPLQTDTGQGPLSRAMNRRFRPGAVTQIELGSSLIFGIA